LSKLVESTIDEDDGAVTGDDDGDDAQEIQLPNVKAAVLAKVIEYCEHYRMEEMYAISTPLKSSKLEDLVQPYYAEYVKLEQTMLFELVTAANFMDIKPLLDLTCLAVSIMIKGKSAEELRKIFNLSEGFTPEEDAAVREENKWAEQPPPPPPSST
jgi:S-phase kinase-associated protein 1